MAPYTPYTEFYSWKIFMLIYLFEAALYESTTVRRCMQKQVKHNEITQSHIRITKKASNFTEISAKYK